MKTIVTALCLSLLFGSSCLGQSFFKKGKIQLGSVLGLSSSTTQVDVNGVSNEGSTAFQLNISPKIGYFAFDNFVGGLGFDYTFNEEDTPSGNESDSDLLFGPYVQGYLPLNEKGTKALFLEVNFGFGSTRDKNELLGLDNSTRVYAIAIGPGFTVVSDDGKVPIGLEASAKYNFGRSKSDLNLNGSVSEVLTKTNQWDFSIGIVFYFFKN